MNKNIIGIISIVAIILSIIAIIVAIASVSMHQGMMNDLNRDEMHNSMNNDEMINMNRRSGSMMMHSVDSELEFIVEMIPHHQEAVDSSKQLLELETSDEELEQLLNEIIIAQESEISMMRSWLQEWYANESNDSNYVEMMPDLSQVDKTQRDEAYIKGMIMHHKMAIMMAQSVLEVDDLRDEVKDLAQNIIITQEEEIVKMRSLL